MTRRLPTRSSKVPFIVAVCAMLYFFSTWEETFAASEQAISRLPGTIVSQIHNAPAWRHSQTYTYNEAPFTRVVNGPGWDEANGAYRPGQPLNAYQLISTGSCKSAGSGGPTGTGDTIAEGTCTWKYISPVDYISITGWAFDNQSWESGSAYRYLNIVVSGSPLRAYALQNESCTSTVAPAGNSGADVPESDGCRWRYLADIIYTSKKSYIPTETMNDSHNGVTIMMKSGHEARLWNDREYAAGQNGEAAPIRLQNHSDNLHDSVHVGGWSAVPFTHLIIRAAPGESFRDKLSLSSPLSGYDPSRGVSIRNNLGYGWPYEPAGLDIHDSSVALIGLQIKSVHGAAVNGMSSYGSGLVIDSSFLEGGSTDEWTSHAAVSFDAVSVISNSFVISHAPLGVVFKYPGFVLHSTIVTAGQMKDSVGISTATSWVFNDTMVADTAIFGFAHAVAHYNPDTGWFPDSSHNVTDAPAGDSGTGSPYYAEKNPGTVDILPGTTYGVAMARAFVDPGTNWQPKIDSPLVGAGSAIGSIKLGCPQRVHDPCVPVTLEFDAQDLINTPRPQNGRYDIGAWQTCPSKSDADRSRCSPR